MSRIPMVEGWIADKKRLIGLVGSGSYRDLLERELAEYEDLLKRLKEAREAVKEKKLFREPGEEG